MIDKFLQEKIDHAYKVLTLAAKMSKLYYQKPLILTYSGGKDSDVMLQLARECLKADDFEVLNSHTTVDAPETVYYIRERFKELEAEGIKATVHYPTYKDGSPKTMWNLIPKKQIPPTRLQRYCCKELKETTTPNRFIAVGVRAAESVGRKGRDDFSVKAATKKGAQYYYLSHVEEVFTESERERERVGAKPNEADVYDCKFIEQAKQKKDLICNPIYTWEDIEIWEFIHDRSMKYNPLYDKGFHRVGCIGCPLSTRRQVELELYPIYKQNYKKALQKLIDKRKAEGKTARVDWRDVESIYKWWIQDDTLDGQLSLFDEVEK